MATMPPPYDSRSARRQAKDYARMQRAYWKSQRGVCRSSIVRPIVLIGIGVVALLLETGRISGYAFWTWYAHWWPVLLIAIGVLLLIEHLVDRNNPCGGSRWLGGVFGLIVICALVGWSAQGMIHWSIFNKDSDHDGFWNWMGQEHDHDVQLDRALPVTGGVVPVVNITDGRGDITVTASTDGQIHLRAHQSVRTGSDEDATKAFDKGRPQIDSTGRGASITVPEIDNMRQDLTIEVPPAASTVVHGDRGDITIEGLKGAVDVANQDGDIKLEDIGANIHAHMHHGDFSAHNVQGGTTIEGEGGDVTLSEINGASSINGDFFGDIHLEQVAGAVSFKSSRTQIALAHLGGSLTLDSGDLNISDAAGPIQITAKGKDIDLSGITGDLTLADSDGDVSVATGLPIGNLNIQNHTGDVNVTLPANASFGIVGTTSSDQTLKTDFPLTTSTDDGQQTVRGQVGNGGPKVNVSTTHGDLEIRKGSDGTLATKAPHFKSGHEVKPAEQ